MARKPDQIIFVCEQCGNKSRPHQVRKWDGYCRHCTREGTWTVVAAYIDSDTQQTAFGFVSSLLIGIGWIRINLYTNTLTATNVPVDVTRFLTADRKLLKSRVAQYVHLRHTQTMQKHGAVNCTHCSASFVPAKNAWNESGFCSRVCATQAGTGTHVTPKCVEHSASMRNVSCSHGHQFEVHKSFTGCMRPCPACGTKTLIP